MSSYPGPAAAARPGDTAGTLRLLAYQALAVTLLVLDHRGGWLHQARTRAGLLVQPVWALAGLPGRLGSGLKDGLASREALLEENRQLRRQIRRMRQGPQSTVFASTPEGEIVEVHGETSIGLRREIRERTESYAQRSLMIVGQECSTAGSAALVVWKACP